MRLIDADALWAEFMELADTGIEFDGEGVANAIANAPTVDAVEVVHGRWERTDHHGFLRCSKCKDVYISDEWAEDGKWRYCPNCGADMRERREGE